MEDIKHGQLDKITSKLLKKNKKKEEKTEETPAEPLVKTCPYCYSEINYKATHITKCTHSLYTLLFVINLSII